MYKGAGPKSAFEQAIWSIPRTSALATQLGRIIGRSGYFVEQLTFFIALLPRLLLRHTDVVYVSDVVLGNLLRLAQKLPFCSYRVLFNNNGPVDPQLLSRWDHIQQVSPEYESAAIGCGIEKTRQTLIPSAIPIPAELRNTNGHQLQKIRTRLQIPTDRHVVLSVGSLSKSRKRMDNTIRELSILPSNDRPFLILLGAQAPDTPEIRTLGNQLLGAEGFKILTVAPHEVDDYYQASDLFVLSSIDEGFGLVYVEALSHGLRVVAHDYPTSRFVLGDHGLYCDMNSPGALAHAIQVALREADSYDNAAKRHQWAYTRFSWEQLLPSYVSLFQHVFTK
jgi:glycosyltransferase involved in cell wall biosynthesis